jgi:ankyrin repeat protein
MKTRFFVLQRLAVWTRPLLGRMKNHTHNSALGATCLIFGLASAAVVARADVVLQEEVEQRGGGYLSDQHQTTRIKGDQARTDKAYSMPGMTNRGVAASWPNTTSNTMISIILDLRSGDSITLLEMFGQKSAVKTSGVQRKLMADAPAKSAGQLTPLPPQNSKQTAMVGGYQTEIYDWTNNNGVSMKLWVAGNFPNYKEINGQLARLHRIDGSDMYPDLTALPGIVMKSETEIGGAHAQVDTTTLLSAKIESVDAAVFVIPEDHHAVNWQNEATAGPDLARMKALLKENPEMVFHKDTNGAPPLHTAAANGEKDVVELLLAHQADVNARDDTGGTALDAALIYGHKDVVELLLAHNADVNARDKDGTTPLHLAAMGGKQEMVELLLAHKADVNATNNIKMTPLHEAVSGNHKEVVELLLTCKADVNARDENGATPLHYAAFKGYQDMVELLLAGQADINAKDNRGATPLRSAVRAGKKDAADLLRQHGGSE